MLRKGFAALIFFLIPVMVVAGCGRKPPEAADTQESVPVKVDRVTARDLAEYRIFPGTVEAAGQVTVTAKMSGRVEAVLVKAGEKVKAGQVLVRLEQQDVKSQVDQAKAGYEAALANYNKINSQLEQEVQRLESALKQAEENYKNTAQNYERMSGLYQDGAISKREFEGIELQYKIAKEQYESARVQLEMTKEKAVPGTVAAAKAQVEQAKAALSAAQSALESTLITAPIDGVVGAVDVKVGQLITPGIPVATLGNTGSMVVKINVSEDVINSVKTGQKVEVAIEAAGVNLEGTVTSVSPYKDARTGTYPVEVNISGAGETVKPGMFARVKLAVATYPKVLAVPEECVLTKGEDKIIYLVEGGKAKAVKVVTGPTVDGFTVIREGLEEGLEIVVEGQEYLDDGAPVEVVGKEEGK
ncbi:efflux RND transporter periplasmic adaptor subunit [Thermosediminibacter oceani]|uniref:Efflux transporter, RND family, MFP subunit n=1 Tax=Thermosediminibacter oceani (strain ATCC BAA-1034 / DSM 16646 / JW/IW-1228P) TaxID=555079 RepID=D9S0M4_THEOJ|nr:efflux RND transporter periplasmic adaptor subunit [Thermosediminibacter oceani]ADL08882.1 efflux transporter, RND family, MFP subunit [Thermosediminibacter oceani DSM 16646]